MSSDKLWDPVDDLPTVPADSHLRRKTAIRKLAVTIETITVSDVPSHRSRPDLGKRKRKLMSILGSLAISRDLDSLFSHPSSSTFGVCDLCHKGRGW